jgi:protein-L-isoaspartate(D-aspartate) O-methyltransferase
MVIPLGDRFNQKVYLMEKRDGRLYQKALRPTLFVPMTGRAQQEAAERRKQAEGKAK